MIQPTDYSFKSGLLLSLRTDPPSCNAIKKETIAINQDLVYNQTCRLSYDLLVISNLFKTFDNRFELIAKIRLPTIILNL